MKKLIMRFDSQFFSSLKTTWLKSKEVYILLQSIDELLLNSDIELTDIQPTEDELSLKNYYFSSISNLKNWQTKSNEKEKESSNNLKISGLDKISCKYYRTSKYSKRIYSLIPLGKYLFIHYLPNELAIKSKPLVPNMNDCYMIKIIDFSPEYIIENTMNAKIFIVFESYLKSEELNKILSFINISFGNVIVNQCNIISNNVISCCIPPQNEKECIIDVYLKDQNNSNNIGKDIPIMLRKISYYDTENRKCFKYIKHKPESLLINNSNTNLNLNNVYPSTISYPYLNSNSKLSSQIFSFTDDIIKQNMLCLLRELKSHIDFYSNNKLFSNQNLNDESEAIKISTLEKESFNEENFNLIFRKIYNQLNELNKVYLIDFEDNFGYNLLHYISALNYSNSIQMFYSFKLNLEKLSKDHLSCYEICAGKRNLSSLKQLIDITEINDNEKFSFDINTLKSALNISLERKNFDMSDLNILDLLIKQIKILYTVESTSGSIINHLKNKQSSDDINFSSVRKIQRAVRDFLRSNQYKRMKKAANRLIEGMKNFSKRKNYLDTRQATIYLQHKIRNWLNQKHKKK